MNHDDILKVLIPALIPAGGVGRWLMVRRRPSDGRPSPARRFGRWLMQMGTANIRLAYVEQNLRDAKEALATKTQEYEESRAANNQLRSDIRQLRSDILQMRKDFSNVSGVGSPIAPIASATEKRPPKRSRATVKSLPTSAAGNRPAISSKTISGASPVEGMTSDDASGP